MDDETPRLRALLEELHGELSRLPPGGKVNDARRAQLDELKSDVERLLARREGTPDATATATTTPEERQHLQGRLQTMVAGFEGAHPQLASAIEQTMNALSNMGL